MKFRITLLCVFLSVIITSSICAQKIYFWKDKDGITNATTTPPPGHIKEYQSDSYGRKSTPAEIEQYNREQRSSEVRKESIKRANRAQEGASQRARRESESATARKEQTERTDRLSKEFWADVDRSRHDHTPVNQNLREEYLKAVSEDPRAITTTRTTTRSK